MLSRAAITPMRSSVIPMTADIMIARGKRNILVRRLHVKSLNEKTDISILDSKLREFQFKLLYRIIYTNHYLYKFKFLSEDVCSYCKNSEETYEHVFFECNKIKELWESCSNKLNLPGFKEFIVE